jgi:hypothetical protein
VDIHRLLDTHSKESLLVIIIAVVTTNGSVVDWIFIFVGICPPSGHCRPPLFTVQAGSSEIVHGGLLSVLL